MTTQEISYYVFDSIEKDDLGCCWGYKNGKMAEVFYLTEEDNDTELIEKGFAKCDAPDWNETMVVEESAWAAL